MSRSRPQAVQTAEDTKQIMEQMTKEKSETLASLEDSKLTNEKLQSEVIGFRWLFCQLHASLSYSGPFGGFSVKRGLVHVGSVEGRSCVSASLTGPLSWLP